MDYTAAIQALLYVAGDDGTTVDVLAQALEMDIAPVRQTIAKLKANLAADTTQGLVILEHGKIIKLATKPEFSAAIQSFLSGNVGQHLSQAALEVLAIIAYQQPITRLEIDDVRGVNSSGALQTLIARQMIQETGRKEVPGRPILYATSDYFLDYFGLTDLKQLPPLTEVEGTDDTDGADVNLFFDKFQNILNDDNNDQGV
ncbi:SMC-Scp complex subunit ScpB [Agrilactobacillus yilanensis]|uniref:Segregation and condensation protein B n=1 Tax=Agrilactobacillus yilanensis TaxID=2485997 RepID=A0ABW4J5R9_9LACO|nr:SMC-Scp complex subunit ScpB [Agrilactobacillus yilanensis]